MAERHPGEVAAVKAYVESWGVPSLIETLAAVISAHNFRTEDDDAEAKATDRQLAAGLRKLTDTHDMSWY